MKLDQTFVLWSEAVKSNAISFIFPLPVDGEFEVVIRTIKRDKTAKQLGALFGLWKTYESVRTGNHPKEIHAQ